MTENLEIKNETLLLTSSTDFYFVPIKNFHWHYDKRTQFLIFDFYDTRFTRDNNYSMSIGFKGRALDDNAGIYRSSYVDAEGNKKYNLNFLANVDHAKI